MASQQIVSQLYAEFSKLGYDVSKMSWSPRDPYGPADAQDLADQALRIADSAVGLHAKNPSDLNYGEVNAALFSIRRAQGYYDTINYTNEDPKPKHVVNGEVEDAINKVNPL